MTDRLKIYNGALLICEERIISSLSVNEEPRYLLDNVWNNGGVRYCLEQAQWRFAMKATLQTYDPAVTPDFGYSKAFPKPTDWIVTSAVCSDEYFKQPLLQYADEVGYWFADLEDIYVKYVSDHADYGGNLALWPESFTRYVETYFASKIAGKMTGGERLVEKISGPAGRPDRGLLADALLVAKNRCAMAGPTTFLATGTWVRSRYGASGRGDRGNPGSLIG